MDGAWDAVIVGVGHNGLVSAAYLAKAGLKVLVLERRQIVGGACITEEGCPGVKFSRLAYSAGLLRPEIIRDLDLARFGYEVHAFDPQFFLPFPDGDSMLLWNDAEKNHKELARFSKNDAVAYPKYVAFWTDVMELIEAMVLESPPPLPDLLGMFKGAEAEELAKRLLLQSAVDPEFLAQVRRIKATGVVTKVNCLLSELPDFTARPGKTLQPHHRGYLDICPSVDYLERAWDDAKWGRPSTEPFLDCVLHSVTDPSLAPPGKVSLSIYSQYSPYRLRDGEWDDRKDEVGDTILETLARFAPNVTHAVEAREVISPLDMEREWGLPVGCIYQTDMTPDQLFSFRPVPGWSGYRTPVRGLYLCGSSAHPGGGVTGAPGRNAAMVVLEDFPGLRA